MGLSVTDAFLRSVLNSPIFGANDYAQILLSFVVAVSFPLCVLSGRLIAIDTLMRNEKPVTGAPVPAQGGT